MIKLLKRQSDPSPRPAARELSDEDVDKVTGGSLGVGAPPAAQPPVGQTPVGLTPDPPVESIRLDYSKIAVTYTSMNPSSAAAV